MLVNPSLSDNSAIPVTPPILPLREYLSAPNIMELALALQSVAFEVMVTLLSFLLHAAREYRTSRIASYCKLSRLCGLPGRAVVPSASHLGWLLSPRPMRHCPSRSWQSNSIPGALRDAAGGECLQRSTRQTWRLQPGLALPVDPGFAHVRGMLQAQTGLSSPTTVLFHAVGAKGFGSLLFAILPETGQFR